MSSPRVSRETIDIENAGNAVSIRMMGATIASLHIRGDAAADYQWDVRDRGGSWIQNAGTEYTGSADYDDDVEMGVSEVRIRCSSGSGGAGDTAEILLSAGGG
jgi:hypothetical protein